MKKKIIMLAAIGVLALAGCSQSTGSGSTATANSDVKLVTDGKLIVATNAEFPPYEYMEGGEAVGIDIDIAKELATKMGLELEVENIAFDSVITEVVTGKADLGISGITATDERRMTVGFSDSYTTARQLIIVNEDSAIAGSADLEGKSIGVQLGTTGDLMASDVKDATVERYQKGVDGVQALIQKKIDAVIIDSEVAKTFVEQNQGIKTLDEAFADEEYAIAIKKENEALITSVNAALSELKSEGKIDEIIGKYIKAN